MPIGLKRHRFVARIRGFVGFCLNFKGKFQCEVATASESIKWANNNNSNNNYNNQSSKAQMQ